MAILNGSTSRILNWDRNLCLNFVDLILLRLESSLLNAAWHIACVYRRKVSIYLHFARLTGLLYCKYNRKIKISHMPRIIMYQHVSVCFYKNLGYSIRHCAKMLISFRLAFVYGELYLTKYELGFRLPWFQHLRTPNMNIWNYLGGCVRLGHPNCLCNKILLNTKLFTSLLEEIVHLTNLYIFFP